MSLNIRTLGEVLASPEDLKWRIVFYIKGKYPFDENTTVVLIPETVHLDTNDEAYLNEQFALSEGFEDAFNASDVREIIDNAKEQLPDVTIEQLIQAFNYYYENDAFIVF